MSDLYVGRFTRWVGVALLLVGGLISAFVIGGNVQWARASLNWPTVNGTITRVALQPATDRNDTFYALVEYNYTPADGVARKSSKLRLESDPYDRKTAEAMIAGLTPGRQHTVYYDPADPDLAVLEPGAAWTEYTPMIIPPLLLAAGVWMAMSLIKSQPRREVQLAPHQFPPMAGVR